MIADVVSRLGLDIETSGLLRGKKAMDDFVRSTDRAEDQANKTGGAIDRMGREMDGLTRMAGRLGAAIGAAFSVAAIVNAVDTWKRVENQIRSVEASIHGVRGAQQGLYAVAQRTFSEFEATASLYVRMTRAGQGLIANQKEALRLVETVNKAMAVGGASTQEKQSAIIQLGQGIASGRLQGDEFRSISENAPMLLEAVMRQTGKARSELRAMAADGKITAALLIESFRNFGDEVDTIFAKFTPTIADAMTNLRNAFTKAMGEKASGIFDVLARGILLLAENMETVIKVATVAGVAMLAAFGPSLVGAIGKASSALTTFLGISASPLMMLVGAVAALGAAAYEFGDKITVATGKFKSELKVLEGRTLDYSVTLRDVVGGAVAETFERIGDVARGVWEWLGGIGQAVGEMIESAFGEGALGRIAGFFGDMMKVGSDAFTNILALGIASIQTLFQNWDKIPAVFGNAFKAAVNLAIGALEWLTNKAIDLLNTFMGHAEGVLGAMGWEIKLPEIPRVALDRLEVDSKAAIAVVTDLVTNFQNAKKGVQEAFGGFWGDVSERAQGSARSRAEEQALQAMAGHGSDLADAAQAEAEAREKSERKARAQDEHLRRMARAQEIIAKYEREIADSRRLAQAYRMGGAQAYEAERIAIDAELRLLEVQADILAAMKDAFPGLDQIQQWNRATSKAMTSVKAEGVASETERKVQEDLRRMEALRDGSRAFWSDFVLDGKLAFDRLGETLKTVFADRLGEALQRAFDPVVQWLADQVSGIFNNLTTSLFGGPGAKGGKGSSGIFGDLFGSLFGGGGKAGAGSGIMGSIGKLFSASLPFLGAMFAPKAGLGTGNQGMDLGLSVGGWAIGSALAGSMGALGMGAGAALGGLLGGSGGALAGMGVGASMGTMLGAIAGPLGMIAALALGSLFTKKPSSHMAAANIGRSGSISRLWGPGGDDEMIPETIDAVQSTAQALKAGQDAIRKLGGSLGAFVSYLDFSANREQSTFRLTDAATGAQGGFIKTGTVGDAEDLFNDAIKEVLKRADFADPLLNSLRDAMTAAGKPFEEIMETMARVKDAIPTEPLSQWQQALKNITDTFEPLIEETKAYADVTAKLTEAMGDAVAKLRGKFEEEVRRAIMEIEAPLALQFEDLVKRQTDRIADAEALGVTDLSQVMRLNSLEMERFLENAADSGEAWGDLSEQFAQLVQRAIELGQDVGKVVETWDRAVANIRAAFDLDIADQIDALVNPTLKALTDLLKAQEARLKSAQELGANVIAVERLNALELESFFKNLSDEQKRQLGDFLGLIEDYTGRIGVVLVQLGDELAARIDMLNETRRGLEDQVRTFRDFAQTIAGLRQNFADQYGFANPRARIEDLRSRFTTLSEQAMVGNQSAMTALPQVAEQLISLSRSLYGSSTAFMSDYQTVQRVLEQVEGSASARANEAQSQLDALIEQVDLLTQIRDALRDPSPALDFLADALGDLAEGNSAVAALLAQYLELQVAASESVLSEEQLRAISLYQSRQRLPASVTTGLYSQSFIPNQQTPSQQATLQGSMPTGGVQTSSADSGAGGSDPVVDALVVTVETLSAGFSELTQAQDETNRYLRALNDQFAAVA